MILQENELKISELEAQLLSSDLTEDEFVEISNKLKVLKEETYKNLTAWDRVTIARSPKRLRAGDLIAGLFPTFFELHGDQLFSDDQSIIAGIGLLKDIPVTILAQAKGKNTNENISRNFGMTSPEGFRKTLRLAKEAEKFHRPIITIVDTSGAYPGKGAEERGQARAIATNLMEFSRLKTPVIAIVLSEGGSGGALALTISDYIYMFENAVYSVLSPEGMTSILFKDTKRVSDVCELMKMKSSDLVSYKIVDEIIKEPLGGINTPSLKFINKLKDNLYNRILELQKEKTDDLVEKRYNKFRNIGV